MLNEPLHTTANHPWLTADRGWLPAGQLRSGEPLVTLAGVAAAASAESNAATAATTMQAVVLGAVVVPGAAPMWDLSLAQVHTFGVGAGQWVVHNCDGGVINDFGELVSKLDKDKDVVVGRWMSRVHDMKAQLEGAGFKVRTWEIRKPATVENNYQWLWRWVKRAGSQVVDIGMPKAANGDTGEFYGMERSMLDRWEGAITRFRYNFGD